MESTRVLFFCVIILTLSKSVSIEHSSDTEIAPEFARFRGNRNNSEFLRKHHLQFKPFQDLFQNGVVGIYNQVLLKETLKLSKRCFNDTQRIQKAVKDKQIWALQILDAFGKIPAGIVDGNIMWLGNYDGCIRINKDYANILQNKEHFNTQYCLAMLQYHSTKETINFPKVKYAVCMPDTCNEDDVKILLNDFIAKNSWKVEDSSITATDVTCKPPPPKFDTLAYVAIIFLIAYGILLTAATAYDVIKLRSAEKSRIRLVSCDGCNADIVDSLAQGDQLIIEDKKTKTKISKEGTALKLLRCFSLYTNGKKILNVDQSMKQLSALNGIRYLSITWVILGHTYYYSILMLSNLLPTAYDHANKFMAQIIATSNISVDSFYALSGVLVAFFMLRELKKTNGKLNWFMVYFHRYWRLTPPYVILLFLLVSLTTYVSQGPLWPESSFEACRRTWWTNLLYINNFVSKTSDMCMGWSWYLATDMQFYIISPFLVLLLFRRAVLGIASLIIIAVASMLTTGILAYKNGYYAGFPDNLAENDLDYGDNYALFYTRPYTRISPYMVGIFTGYILYKTECTCKFKKVSLMICWTIAAFFGCLAVFGLYHKYGVFGRLSAVENAFYSACHRTVWACAFCWVIFACATGNGGYVNTLMSWKPFVLLGRLSFCMYLVHPLFMSIYVNDIRRPVYYTDIGQVYLYFGFLVLSSMGAFVWSLLFETPMMSLEKILFRRNTKE